MLIKVIYPDGTLGVERFTALTDLIKLGKIVAFQYSRGWVETRRKQKYEDYSGPERRNSSLPISNI